MKYNPIELSLIIINCKNYDELLDVAKILFQYPCLVDLSQSKISEMINIKMEELTI